MAGALSAAVLLGVSITAGVGAMWLLSRLDSMSPGRRLGRRWLLVVSVMATAAIPLGSPERFRGGAGVLSLFMVMALSIAATAVHHRRRTGILIYQLELAMIWWMWLGCRFLLFWHFRLSMVIIVGILWVLFAFFGWLALYPARREI